MVFPAALNLSEANKPGNMTNWLTKCNVAISRVGISTKVANSHSHIGRSTFSWRMVLLLPQQRDMLKAGMVKAGVVPSCGVYPMAALVMLHEPRFLNVSQRYVLSFSLLLPQLTHHKALPRIAQSVDLLVDDGDVRGEHASQAAWRIRSSSKPKKKAKAKLKIRGRKGVAVEEEVVESPDPVWNRKDVFWNGLLHQDQFDAWNSVLEMVEGILQKRRVSLKRNWTLWTALEDWRMPVPLQEAHTVWGGSEPDERSVVGRGDSALIAGEAPAGNSGGIDDVDMETVENAVGGDQAAGDDAGQFGAGDTKGIDHPGNKEAPHDNALPGVLSSVQEHAGGHIQRLGQVTYDSQPWSLAQGRIQNPAPMAPPSLAPHPIAVSTLLTTANIPSSTLPANPSIASKKRKHSDPQEDINVGGSEPASQRRRIVSLIFPHMLCFQLSNRTILDPLSQFHRRHMRPNLHQSPSRPNALAYSKK
jgi:hypothetical protein